MNQKRRMLVAGMRSGVNKTLFLDKGMIGHSSDLLSVTITVTIVPLSNLQELRITYSEESVPHKFNV